MEIKQALTFRASSIGDCLMGKYLLENVHAQFPDARFGIVVAGRGAMIRDLLAAYPWIEVVEANRHSPRALLSLFARFHGSDFAVTQYAGKRGGKFGFASKVVARLLTRRGGFVGFKDVSKWNGILYDHLLPVRPDAAVAEHEREALRAAGLSVTLPFPTLACVPNEAVLEKHGLTKGAYLITHFFAGNKGRSLSPQMCRELLVALGKKLPGKALVITGSAADREAAERIAQDLANVRIVAGEATLQETMNLITHSAGVVSVDTGVAHLAAHLGVPLVVMRTCLGPNWWFPEQYGAEARITVLSHDEACTAGHTYKDYPDCINMIDIEDVVRHAMRLRK